MPAPTINRNRNPRGNPSSLIPFGQPGNTDNGAKGWWDTHPEKLLKLEQAFAQGNTDEDACAYAELPYSTFWYYISEVNPAFGEKREQLKAQPILKMNNIVIRAATGYEETDKDGKIKRIIPADVSVAQWYLERKRKKEFALRTEVTGADSKSLLEVSEERKKKLNAFLNGKPIHQALAAAADAGPVPSKENIPARRNEINVKRKSGR